MMKRRNVDCVKPRRPYKRTKIGEGIYASTFIYIKFLLIWLLVLGADFLIEFRFEYLWPSWMLLRSVYDSLRYQGVAFSVLFVFMALTSDMICLLFIPVNWLIFAASTYVWVQFVWHTERGVCMPTIILWVLFIYVEAVVRSKDIKNVPFYLDLCRPFAAHCIGYPVVTFGFGLKSYVGYRLRQRRQREVAKENKFYMQLIQEALPPELNAANAEKCLKEKEEESINGDAIQVSNSINHTGGSLINNCISSGSSSSTSSTSSNSSSGGGKNRSTRETRSGEETPPRSQSKHKVPNGTIHAELEYMQKKGWSTSKSVNDFDESEPDKDKISKLSNNSSFVSNSIEPDKKRSNSVHLQSNGSAKLPGSHTNNFRENSSSGNNSRDKKNKNKDSNKDSVHSTKEEGVSRLESDIKRLKADLQSSRQMEQDLRNELNTLKSSDKITRQDMNQLQQDNDNLQNKLHGLVTGRQNDRATISQLERRLTEERRARQTAENQVVQLERRSRKLMEEQSQARAHALNAKGECSESCRNRRSEVEGEIKRMRRDQRVFEDRTRALERENINLRQYKESQSETEVLMSALSAMQEKHTHLESSLSAETRVKLDLFSALGEAKRQIKINQDLVIAKDKEIDQLKAKITEVLAVCPPNSFSGSSLDSYHYSSKLLNQVSSSVDSASSMVMSDALLNSSSLVDPMVLGFSTGVTGVSLSSMNHSRPSLPISPPIAASLPNHIHSVSTHGICPSPAPISPPLTSMASQALAKPAQHSTLDPNARIYTPKGIPISE